VTLAEVLPAVVVSPVYRYMRQTTRTNNAAPVASGAQKPISVYGLTPTEGRLHVLAHVSEPLDKFDLSDNGSLSNFVRLEMLAGLATALEDELLNGDGTAEHLTGLSNTVGIQAQAWTTSEVLTCRAAITKVQVLGYSPAWFVFAPADWETIETSTLTAGQYVLNAEGSRSGVPVDSAARRLWGIPVAVTTAATSGVGYLISAGCAQIATDGAVSVETSDSVDDDFRRNAVRLRVESRYDLAVTRPAGIVEIDLTAL
jgi:HK97 family phage major capsid protein